MGLAQRVKIDQLIQQKYSGMINKLTMKLESCKEKRDRKRKKESVADKGETRCVNFTNKLVK